MFNPFTKSWMNKNWYKIEMVFDKAIDLPTVLTSENEYFLKFNSVPEIDNKKKTFFIN